MRFEMTDLSGLVVVEAEPHRDSRGSFARLFCPQEFAEAGLDFTPVQVNLSHNIAARTLRGMHYQEAPLAEAKLVRCTSGAIFDVALDLRPQSPTYRQWRGFELSRANARAVLVPEGFAHGFITLQPDSDVLYQMGRAFVPGHERGIRFDDPAFNIAWPFAPEAINPRDAAWPDYRPINSLSSASP
ncbi:MAG: dTDP-4-dehydrorhamnose 3,5-epimerase family protein [Hyphomicrobiales bacterium]|nr:dTDP-4-dehydrorhamnose 3,5-epimerase family protein [Hyphomicrobiales bacterium]